MYPHQTEQIATRQANTRSHPTQPRRGRQAIPARRTHPRRHSTHSRWTFTGTLRPAS
jgi:hypothetical protein